MPDYELIEWSVETVSAPSFVGLVLDFPPPQYLIVCSVGIIVSDPRLSYQVARHIVDIHNNYLKSIDK
jgi:hypothetical protein